MKRDSFTQALRATAKIACAASLLSVSCRSKTPSQVAEPNTNDTAETEMSDTNEDTSTDTEDTSTNTEDTSKDTEDTDTEDTNTSTPEEEYAECLPLIEETFANVDFPETDTISQEVKDCCALTAAYYDTLALESGDGMYDYTVIDGWEYRDQCCAAIEWSDGSTACTPWGPPTPPSAQKMKRKIIVHQHAVLA